MKCMIKMYIFCTIGIFLCCHSESSLQKRDRIRIFYPINKVETPYSLEDCDLIFGIPALTDTIIINQKFVGRLDSIISSLIPTTNDTDLMNFRIKCIIRYSNHTQKIICLGENRDIVVDGIRMQDNEELFKIINDVIYKEIIYIEDPYDLPIIDYDKKW